MRQRSFTLGFLLLACLWPVMAHGQLAAPTIEPVSIARLTPPSPATLKPGEEVRIDFRYSVRSKRGFRIFIRPMTGSELSSDYAASGSELYTARRGTGASTFTLKSAGRVDRLRIVVVEDETNRHLHRSYVDVGYRFAPPFQSIQMQLALPQEAVAAAAAPDLLDPAGELQLRIPPKTLEQLGRYRPPAWRPLPGVELPDVGDSLTSPPGGDGIPSCFDRGIDAKECAEVAGRRITADGIVILDCADGSSWRTTTAGDVYTAPDGQSCRVVLYALMSQGTALPPAEPPEGLSAAEWAQFMDAWLSQGVARNLLERIEFLVGSEYFANYQQLEAEKTHNLYQEIDYRLAFLDKLMEGQ